MAEETMDMSGLLEDAVNALSEQQPKEEPKAEPAGDPKGGGEKKAEPADEPAGDLCERFACAAHIVVHPVCGEIKGRDAGARFDHAADGREVRAV